MYQGEVHIGQEQLKEFLRAAQLLQVRGLTDVPAPAPIPTLDQKASPVSESLTTLRKVWRPLTIKITRWAPVLFFGAQHVILILILIGWNANNLKLLFVSLTFILPKDEINKYEYEYDAFFLSQ